MSVLIHPNSYLLVGTIACLFLGINNLFFYLSSTESSEWIWDEFEETPKFSTFEVFYAILPGNLSEVTTNFTKDIKIRTWVKKDGIEKVKYLHQNISKAFDFFESIEVHFKTNSTYKTIHQIILPNLVFTYSYFGLVLHGENNFNNPNGSAFSICEMISSQLWAKVSLMQWWSEYWFSFGIPLYITSLCTDQLLSIPNFNYEDYRTYTIQALHYDSKNGALPISRNDTNDNVFSDNLRLCKSMALIRMLGFALGKHSFHQGVMNYFKKNSRENEEKNDVWAFIEDAARQNNVFNESFTIKELVDSWTTRPGYPLITVTRDYEKNTAIVTQSRYLSDGSESCWLTPISYTTEDEHNFKDTQRHHWLQCNGAKSIPLTIENIASDKWIIFNIQYSGFYRVNYDFKNWDLIVKALNQPDFGNIHIMNRVQIVNDVISLANSTNLNYTEVINNLPEHLFSLVVSMQ